MRWKTSWIACCMVAFALNVHAQVWERITVLAPSDSLLDIEYLQGGRVVAVGVNGAVIISDDTCDTWRNVYSGTVRTLHRTKFVNANDGWAVGDHCTILHTSDGGESWVEQECASTRALRGIDFVDELNGCVVGDRGHYFCTSDGGQSWTGSSDGDDRQDNLMALALSNSLNGIAVGGYSIWEEPEIRVTEDGGESWNDGGCGYEGWFADIEHISGNSYFAVGRHHLITHTENGNWFSANVEIYFTGRAAFRDIEFFDNNVGLTVSDSGRLFQTTDGGNVWQEVVTENVHSRALEFVNEFKVLSAGKGVSISLDGGHNWDETGVIPSGNILDVEFLSDTVGWLLCENNVVWKTEDGETFTPDTLSIGTFGYIAPMTSIDFVNSQLGFAVGDHDSIFRTTDAGETWFVRESGTHFPLHEIKFANELRGWAVSDVATILGTRDGGDTWNVETTNTGGFLTSLAIVDEHHAWAVGAGGTLLRTRDGETWETLEQIHFEDFYGLYFHDALTGFAVGGNGLICKTTDGGESWTSTIVQASTLFAVEFANALDGWVAGESGALYRTRDGGETWLPEVAESVYHLNDVWVSPTRGWGGGVNGTILRSDHALPADDDTQAPLPTNISLSLYPNPFNSTATLQFELPRETRVEIVLYDVLGRVALQLADEIYTSGAHTLKIDAAPLTSGVYFANLRTPEFSTTQKLLLLR